MRPAIFLDRDGVLVEDLGPTGGEDFTLLCGVPEALRRLERAGYLLLTVTNQAVVARGWVSEEDVVQRQRAIERAILAAGGPALDGFYYCPHHPHAQDARYRRTCACRKPAPGLILAAAAAHDVALERSFVVGDRGSDIEAGRRAGCRTIWAQTGRHRDPAIVGAAEGPVRADHTCANLQDAAAWIAQEAR